MNSTKNDASPYDGLADNYTAGRPAYPSEAIEKFDLARSGLVVDVGAGTGILSRGIGTAFPDATVIGVEPSSGMLAEAEAASRHLDNVSFALGNSDNLPLKDNIADIVTVGTALHWFDRPKFYAEANRILKSDGRLIILYNNRNWQECRLFANYEMVLEMHVPSYERGLHPVGHGSFEKISVEEELRSCNEKKTINRVDIDWSEFRTADEVLSLMLSSSITELAIQSKGLATIRADLENTFDGCELNDGRYQLDYTTTSVCVQ